MGGGSSRRLGPVRPNLFGDPTLTTPHAPATDAAVAGVAAQLSKLIAENPNDPQVLRAVERLLDATGGSPGALRPLFELYLHPDLRDGARGVVTAIMVKNIRRHAGLFDPRALGLDPSRRAFKMIYRGLGHHLDMAVDEIGLLARFQNGEMDEAHSPKFIVAIPKSGSSMLGICLGNMMTLTRGGSLEDDPFLNRGYPAWWSLGATHDWDLRPEIGADPLFRRFPGGIYKGHITPCDKNFAILGLYDASRYLVVIRDPRDQIVAAYCDHMRARRRAGGGSSGPPPGAEEVRADLLRYMRSGTLLENLTFVGKWLARRDPARSLVVTYERLVGEPERVLGEVAAHFRLGVSAEQVRAIHRRASAITDRVGGQDQSGYDPTIYPLGWTGRVGVWRTYFSEEAAGVFERSFDGFGAMCPWGDLIREVYPDLDSTVAAGAAPPGRRAAG